MSGREETIPSSIPVYAGPLPWLTTEQMVLVDRLMVEEAHVLLIQMMENAGRSLAHLARVRFLDGDPRGREVTVLAGTGGNGGGALVCARRLHAWGARVRVVVSNDDERFREVPRHQLDVVRRMRIPVSRVGNSPPGPQDLIVDGVIGYGIQGTPAGDPAEMIRWANASGAPTLSLDVPSGLDSTTGHAWDPTIRATATLTLALPKEGLRIGEAPEFVGELYLADIGVPPTLYSLSGLGLDLPPVFAASDVVRLKPPAGAAPGETPPGLPASDG